jgi:hypothetical protein
MGSDCGAQSRMSNGENALELELLVPMACARWSYRPVWSAATTTA